MESSGPPPTLPRTFPHPLEIPPPPPRDFHKLHTASTARIYIVLYKNRTFQKDDTPYHPPSQVPASVDDTPPAHPLKPHPPWDGHLPPPTLDANAPALSSSIVLDGNPSHHPLKFATV